MNEKSLRQAVDENDWRRRKTCAAPSGYDPDHPAGREGADYDADDYEASDYERLHLRGTERCGCGGFAIYYAISGEHRAWCSNCHRRVTLPESAPITALIDEWNKSVARRKFLKSAVEQERREKRESPNDKSSDGSEPFAATHG